MGFKFKHIFKGVGKVIKPVNKILTPMLGAAVGTMVGGPAGGVLGASLAGASMRGGHNRLKGALHGAATGTLYQALAPTIASALGATSSSPFIGSATGLGSPSLLHQLGLSSAPSMGGGLGLIGNAGNAGLLPNLSMGKVMGMGMGALQNIPHPRNPFEGGAESAPIEFPNMDPESYEMYMNQGAPSLHGHGQENPMFQSGIGSSKPPLSPLDVLRMFSPRIPFGKTSHGRVEKEEKPKKAKKDSEGVHLKFAQGGRVKLSKKEMTGHISESDSGGQDDDIYMDIPPNAYVMNATDVSLLGDGSTRNGIKKIKQFEKSLEKRAAPYKIYDNPRKFGGKPVEAKVSNDEYVLRPSTVFASGGGNVNKGVKILDNGRKTLRKQKGVKAILPPRTKSMNYYMKGGG